MFMGGKPSLAHPLVTPMYDGVAASTCLGICFDTSLHGRPPQKKTFVPSPLIFNQNILSKITAINTFINVYKLLKTSLTIAM